MKRTNMIALAVIIAFFTLLPPGEAGKVKAGDIELYNLRRINANVDYFRRKENQGNTNLFQRGLNRFCITQQIYQYIGDESNRQSAFSAAIALNGNKSANSCVYFISEVLRRNGIAVPSNTANTVQLVLELAQRGWSWGTDYKELKPGDIAFTTDSTGRKIGIPSHTYIFMGWVSEGSYDYAYICDNQAKDYDNKIYHIRNIRDRDNVDGKSKDAFNFFMRSN